MTEFDLYYFKVIGELEKVKSKRSLKERTIFDKEGKRMRQKLEKGYIKGVQSAIKVLKSVKKDFDKQNEEREMEHKERAFIQ